MSGELKINLNQFQVSEPPSEAYNLLQMIRTILEKQDDLEAFKEVFSQRNMQGKDFMFWPPNLPVLHYCAIQNRPKCLKYLVEELKFNINQVSKKGYNPVHYAAYYGNVEILKLLLSYCPDISIKNKYGENVQEIAQKKLDAKIYAEIQDFFEFNAVK